MTRKIKVKAAELKGGLMMGRGRGRREGEGEGKGGKTERREKK